MFTVQPEWRSTELGERFMQQREEERQGAVLPVVITRTCSPPCADGHPASTVFMERVLRPALSEALEETAVDKTYPTPALTGLMAWEGLIGSYALT